MKKLNKVAALFATAALITPMAAFAQAKTVDNWRAADGTVWKNGTNDLCWRDANWTPNTAAEKCDGAAPASRSPAAPAAAPACCSPGSSASGSAAPAAPGAGEREGHLRG